MQQVARVSEAHPGLNDERPPGAACGLTRATRNRNSTPTLGRKQASMLAGCFEPITFTAAK